MSGPAVSIVIPVFNRVELTQQCLLYLAQHTTGVTHEVIVVDNASTDGTAAFLAEQEQAGRVRVIRNEANAGFGRACNQAAAIARGEHLVLLNNDTVPLPGWLDALVATVERDPGVGVVGSRLLYPNETIQHAGMVFRPNGMLDHVHRGAARDAAEVLEAQDFACVTGACLLLPRALFERLGGFDETYYFYLEDVDLCLRVWEAGLRVRYCPESVLFHYENASVQDTRWRDEKVLEGLALLHRRWAGRWPAGVRRLAWPLALPGGPPHFTALAYAEELVARPELLAAYARAFAGHAEATLVIAVAPRTPEISARLTAAVAEAGLAGDDAPDLLALDLGQAVHLPVAALYSAFPATGPLAALPRFDERSVDGLAALAAGAPPTLAAAS